jgi:1-acyl-sn-glycerol-3-phosphate acyltransferase
MGLWTCMLIFPLSDHLNRQRHIKQWSIKLLQICDVRVTIYNQTIDVSKPLSALIVSNHISWLDIFVINSLHPCRFVAKSEIRNWPLIGWLSEKVGTIFISRAKLRDIRKIYQELVTIISTGERVVFSPEGTTAIQGMLRPFHSNLFEAAINAKMPIQPFALRYVSTKGIMCSGVDFVGKTTFSQSLMNVLKTKNIIAELIMLPIVLTNCESNRQELAKAIRKEITNALEKR